MAGFPIKPIPRRLIQADAENARWFEDVRRELNRLRAYKQVSENYTTNGELILGFSDTSSAWTLTLRTSDMVAGKLIIVKDESNAAGTNNITIATQGTETIDGASTQTIGSNRGYLKFYSNGTNWFLIT